MASDPPTGFADPDKLFAPARYRVLLLGAAGQVTRMVPIQANGDAHAERMAQSLADDHPVELWDGMRFIEQFEPIVPPYESY